MEIFKNHKLIKFFKRKLRKTERLKFIDNLKDQQKKIYRIC